MGAKAAATAAVAQLCREPGGLEALMEQPVLLQVGVGVGLWRALHAQEQAALLQVGVGLERALHAPVVA